MTLTLAIEISNPSSASPGGSASQVGLGRIAHSGSLEILDIEIVDLGGRDSDDLIPAIDRLCLRVGVGPRDLRRIAVDIGPGGFTGLRVAVAAASAMGEALGLRVIGVPAAEVAAQRARQSSGAFCVVLATKGETGYIQRFNADGVTSGEPQVADAQGLEQIETTRLIADSHLPPAWLEVARQRGWSIEPVELSASALLTAASGMKGIDPSELRPIYAREPEAVTLWRARHPKSK